MPVLYLASKSPRRREILAGMGISDIEVIHAGPAVLTAFEGDETQHDGESPQDYVVRTACEKARQAMDRIAAEGKPSLPVLAADTVVICGDEILGKPEDAAKARLFMQKLSGRSHEVRTAVVVSDGISKQLHVAVSVSQVTFSRLCLSLKKVDTFRKGKSCQKWMKATLLERATGSFVQNGVNGPCPMNVLKL